MAPNHTKESLTIKQAQHKNHALEEQLSIVQKVIEQERAHREDDIERERKKINTELDKIKHVKPPPPAELYTIQKNRKKVLEDVCMHIVYCYLRRQEKNRSKWKDDINYGRLKERPVTTPDHYEFISDRFPQVFKVSENDSWNTAHCEKADIFEHGKAAHDMKCLSTRSKPVVMSLGVYPAADPLNIRFWRNPAENKNANANANCAIIPNRKEENMEKETKHIRNKRNNDKKRTTLPRIKNKHEGLKSEEFYRALRYQKMYRNSIYRQ